MKPTHNGQINTKTYWDQIYTTPSREQEYWSRTFRFFTAVDYVHDGDKFLDIGCGVGVPCRLVQEKKKGCETWGVDISHKVIESNKTNAPETKWHQGYIGALTFLPREYFDVIFCGEVIEHLDRPEELFREAYSVLKKGGKLIITTPKEDHIISPEHVWEYEKSDIEKLFVDQGFNKLQFVDLPDMEHLTVFFAVGEK